MRRVVVTGLGMVSPLGCGVETTWKRILNSESGAKKIGEGKIGEGVETELAANMVFSMHPHAIAEDGVECLYMQDTWLVTDDGGVPLADLEMRIW